MTDALPALERLIIEAECRRLVAVYCRLIDSHDHEALLELWTADAVWTSVKGAMHGRGQIKAYLDGKPRGLSRHLCGNHLIDVETPDTATGTCDFVVHIGEDDPHHPGRRRFRPVPLVGRYHDAYRRQDGRWLFASRRMELFPGAA